MEILKRQRRGIFARFEGSSIERAHQSCVLKRKGQESIRNGARERETEAEGVGVKALRDTTPVASTRLPKEPPFGNRASSSTGVDLSTVACELAVEIDEERGSKEIIDCGHY